MEAIGVTTRGIHRSDKGLQTDVANQFIVHIILVFVQMAFKAFVLLATLLTDPRPRQTPIAASSFGLRCRHCLIEFTYNFCASGKDVCPAPSLKNVLGIFHFQSKSPLKLWTCDPKSKRYLQSHLDFLLKKNRSKMCNVVRTTPSRTSQLHRKWQIHRATAIWQQATAAVRFVCLFPPMFTGAG